MEEAANIIIWPGGQANTLMFNDAFVFYACSMGHFVVRA